MNPYLIHAARRPLRALLKLVCVAAVVTGCGGGGSPGRSSLSVGPISGFGSIIVNGVRYDDSSASVSSDDDDNGESRSRSDLKLGMMVEVRANGVTTDNSGSHSSAHDIRFGSEIVGPVGTITPSANTFTVLGQTIKVDASTAFDNSLGGGFAAIKIGQILEVHGPLDSANSLINATRIELEDQARFFKLRGVVAGLVAGSFKIGSETISTRSLSPQPTNLANGQIVRVKLQTTQVDGAWVAIKLGNGVRGVEDHDEAEIKGSVSDFQSMSDFKVNGIAVNAGQVANPPSLKNGDFVEVKGRSQGGILIAAKVELEDRNRPGSGQFEFHGRIEQLSSDRKSFVLRSMTIVIGDQTLFDKGATRDNLANNNCVEVKAVPVSGSATLSASLIKFDNDCAP
ncbi:MAG: DUF5666 domain-containing protein [Burkholderiaceae bacterium]